MGENRQTECQTEARTGHYTGWVTLGGYDARVQRVCRATFEAILAGKRNPPLDYNGSLYGRISLAGHLAKTDVRLGLGADP